MAGSRERIPYPRFRGGGRAPAIAAAATVLVVVLAATAGAGGVGRPNGLIAFDRADPASTQDDTFIFTANPDGSRARRLFKGHSCCPGWSHDGRRIAIPASLPGDRIGTATINADGSSYRILRYDDRTLSLGCFVWLRGNRALACEGLDEKRTGRNGIYLLPATGGSPKRLTKNTLGGTDLPGAYSPDGKRLVFSRFNELENGIGLFIVNADGTGLHRVTPGRMIIQAETPATGLPPVTRSSSRATPTAPPWDRSGSSSRRIRLPRAQDRGS